MRSRAGSPFRRALQNSFVCAAAVSFVFRSAFLSVALGRGAGEDGIINLVIVRLAHKA
jgi:hypothetical protein